jgi:hypothetical protein
MDGSQAHEQDGMEDCLTTTKSVDSEHNLQLKTERFRSHRLSRTRMKISRTPLTTDYTMNLLGTRLAVTATKAPWQMVRAGRKLGGSERHFFKRRIFFKKGSKRAVNQ